MTQAAMPHNAASHSGHAGHAPHPNYIAVFIWLIILTALEVSIPEFVHIRTTGPDPRIPTVSEVTRAEMNSDDPRIAAAASMAPSERFAAAGWSTKIAVLMVLAVIKAGLVGAFFMHLRFEGWKLNAILAAPTVLFVIIIFLSYWDVGLGWPRLY